jgi:putative ABC transport system substrate-binding protein
VSSGLAGWRFLFTCGLLVVSAVPLLASAEQPSIPRIGVLNPQSAAQFEEYLRRGLRELGYAEGQNILVEWRRGATSDEDMRAQATDLARLNVDLIVTIGSPATRAALQATTKPVVMQVGDPVLGGFAASLRRPGGRATGVSIQTSDLNRKRLDLLHQLAPRARRVACLTNYANPLAMREQPELQSAARALNMKLLFLPAKDDAEIEAALQSFRVSAVDAVLVTPDLTWLANKTKVARAVREARIPAVFPYREYHEAGALLSYSVDEKEAFRRMATYVDKILKGANPAELPIEQISTYEVVIDLRIAREMRIQVPQELLYRANEVIR